jgi:hypothetical protein
MNQVKTINELINRTWRAPATALALTLFVFLFGTTTARAQGAGTRGGAGKVAVHDVGFRRQCQRRARANRTDYFSRIYSRPFAS